ncbi:MAG: 2-dehydro-3-deoxy-6-phosphogalactonate aldolase [Burkholderiales bacterium]|nr:2-dehydro-3-deoxy-6-phosphogalactonate aldolase [Burkholderiales bacterium]
MSAPLQGVIAILRGVAPAEVLAVGHALVAGGIRIIEVPLNSPEPFDSISRLAREFGGQLLIGAGTVLTPAEVDRVADAGGRLVLAPNFDAAVVRQGRARGLLTMPGVATPSEGFQALAAGADALKLFPAEMLGPPVLKSWRAVFPQATPMFAVGGIGLHNLAAFKAAGASGVGTGSSLYAPGTAVAELTPRARALVAGWAAA